jgi:hypothetical protein
MSEFGAARSNSVRGYGPTGAPVGRRRSVPYFLPAPVSSGHALSVLLAGFLVEGATEAYQFVQRTTLGLGWPEYYTTLATTILGFYLMFLGLREWRIFHPRPVRRRAVPWRLIQLFSAAGVSIGSWVGLHSAWLRRKYLIPWMIGVATATVVLVVATVMVDRGDALPRKRGWPVLSLTLWGGGTAATAVLIVGEGGLTGGSTPIWLAAPVGGIVVLAFGQFFYGLQREARPFGSPLGRALGWAGFGWSLGVATIAGYVVGERAVLLLTEFFSNWGALIVSVAPIVVAMSPLFVSYALMVGAFLPQLTDSAGRGLVSPETAGPALP